MEKFTPITNYLLYLRRECGLSVSVHPSENDGFLITTPLMNFNIHENPYCILVKSNVDACKTCICKQSAVLKRVKEEGSFVGTCHAGVREYVYPILSGSTVTGFLSVSGYASPIGREKMRGVTEKYGFDAHNLNSAYSTLKTDFPPKEQVDTLITPLLSMIELAYVKNDADYGQKNSFFDSIVSYIKRNYTLDLSSDELCKYFSCSRSHLSHTFNAFSGTTIREYVNSLRVESAKVMLLSSDLTIAEIAVSLGYSDANYFSSVFKRITGTTPSAYKKTTMNMQNLP